MMAIFMGLLVFYISNKSSVFFRIVSLLNTLLIGKGLATDWNVVERYRVGIEVLPKRLRHYEALGWKLWVGAEVICLIEGQIASVVPPSQ